MATCRECLTSRARLDRGHAAGAALLLDLISVGEGRCQTRKLIGHMTSGPPWSPGPPSATAVLKR